MTAESDGAGSPFLQARPVQELAVVIGAGGMSTVVARRLGQQNRLLICDIDAEKLSIQVEKLVEDGCVVEGVVCDITSPDSVASLAERVQSLGGLSKLAHVAGLSPSMADWRTILSVNLQGPALVAEQLFKVAKPGPVAVLISSLSAHMTSPAQAILDVLDKPSDPGLLEHLNDAMQGAMSPQQAYMLSKLGVIRLARRLAVEWGKSGGRVVSLSPGLIASPQGLGEFKAASSKHRLLSQCPLQRQGGMQEIADAVEFLMSSRATYISGTDLLVDGGVSAVLAQ